MKLLHKNFKVLFLHKGNYASIAFIILREQLIDS